ncbi:hypothetical protein GCM10017783_18570 [Deinococcus piscis]|uniref:Sulfotransferase n=1 Tax=Deinococcus piscis TaxID=394230 RepID=A0ABQ3KA19_9DEIO|nr:hypothetical protein [Deinococcus piscis]GHG06226.1 hypothetical protein GCM10017783_18570 [Deinococcus piscis]
MYRAFAPLGWASGGQLLRALRERRPEPLRVYLDAHPQKVRDELSAALEGAGFVRSTAYDMSKSLFGQPRRAEYAGLTSWDDATEAQFCSTYERLAGPLEHLT